MIEIGKYNSLHLQSVKTTFQALRSLKISELEELKKLIAPYIKFREDLKEFTKTYFLEFCREKCFKTSKSLCCGYESIIVFFADEVINYLFGNPKDFEIIIEKLSIPNNTNHCVYLGENGCLWTVRPISCAMFFCEEAKNWVFSSFSEEPLKKWNYLQKMEKTFTWPDKPILFDELEEYFIKRGVWTSHMYFHKSPGLLKIKQERWQKNR